MNMIDDGSMKEALRMMEETSARFRKLARSNYLVIDGYHAHLVFRFVAARLYLHRRMEFLLPR